MPVFPGFNTNITPDGVSYHIQTQVNSTEKGNQIVTLVYTASSGEVCYSKTSELAAADSVSRETAAVIIEKQHDDVISLFLSRHKKVAKPRPRNKNVDFCSMYSTPEFRGKLNLEGDFLGSILGR